MKHVHPGIAGIGYQMIGVAGGGAVGGAMRQSIDMLLPAVGFPWSALIVNVVGAFLLGVLHEQIRRWKLSRFWKCALTTGLIGALTTFSSFILETLHLFDSHPFLGISYLLISLFAGLMANWLGYAIGHGRSRLKAREEQVSA